MAQRHQNRSYWIDSFELPTFPPLRTEIDVDVCVIGAGIVGTTAARLLSRAGRSLALVEMDRALHGTTGNTTAKVTSTQGTVYQTLV
jgi:heterodisulfide reductase subunit A-like polyferredoxin